MRVSFSSQYDFKDRYECRNIDELFIIPNTIFLYRFMTV